MNDKIRIPLKLKPDAPNIKPIQLIIRKKVIIKKPIPDGSGRDNKVEEEKK